MSWERFQYICRRSHELFRRGESVSDAIRSAQGERGASLYGEDFSKGSLPGKLLEEITTLSDRDKIASVLKVYGELRLDRDLALPPHFRRASLYLVLVMLVFSMAFGIYFVKVMPTFMDIFESQGMAKVPALEFFVRYSGYLYNLVLVAAVLVLLLGRHIKKLLSYEEKSTSSGFYQLMTLPEIHRRHRRIVAAIRYPITGSENGAKDLVASHLKNIENSGMSVAYEMQRVIGEESRRLLQACERQMRMMIAFIGIAVVLMAGYFLYSAYTPLFLLGEVS